MNIPHAARSICARSLVALCLVALVANIVPAQRRSRRKTSSVVSTSRAAPQDAPANNRRNSVAQTLPLRRVILYSNGVAYFERRGTVRGRAEVELAFKQSQVDDVLKSMVVLDLGQGRIGTVSYNSSQPPQARLADIPFSIEAGTSANADEGGLAGVLRQLQGARVVVATANRTVTGSVLTVERRTSQAEASKPPVTSHRLVVASAAGEIADFDLGEVRSVKLLDDEAQRDLREFADASASARRRDAKTIVVTSDGEGAREMLVSYTIAAPVWKTTYRVVMDAAGQPFFQGWAIVDNVSEEDWTDVRLSLVSGTPISFIQPIQQPFYRYRPVVPMPGNLNLEPQTYEPGVGEGVGYGAGGGGGMNDEVIVTAESAAVEDRRIDGRQVKELPRNARRRSEGVLSLAPGVAAPPPAPSITEAITDENSGVTTAATGGEVGDLFEYRVDRPVTLKRDRSALIPILQTRMTGERVSVYNEAVRADRPLGGMLLKNTSPLTLEGGSLTVIDSDAYAGEALMERLKPNEDRLISYALDLGTLVAARTDADREPVFLVKASNGVLQAHFYRTERKTYTLTNQTERARTVYIERPARQGWELKDADALKIERTPRTYRVRVELSARGNVVVPVTERQAIVESFALSNFTSENLDVLVARRYIDAPVRARLAQIVETKARIAALDNQSSALEAEATEINEDQARLRENIKALGDNSEARALIARYVEKANTQETRLEALTAQRRQLAAQRATLQAELDRVVREFTI